MHPCSNKEGQKQSLTGSNVPCSSHCLKPSPLKQQSVEEKSAKVKRRRTRRERNYVKFGRNMTDRAPEQRPAYKAGQKTLLPFWSSQLSKCAKSTSIQARKGLCVAKPVIITQNRLSQHLGMFNREVKSVDIERLLNPSIEHETMEVTPVQIDCRDEMPLEDEILSCKPHDANPKSFPNEHTGFCVKESCGMNEDCLKAAPVVTKLMVEHDPASTLNATEAESQPAVAEFSQPTAESEAFQSNSPVHVNEKENVSPVLPARAEIQKGKSPVKELAEDLQKLLDLRTVFPGRDFISETRQAVIRALSEQKKTLPDFSALARLRKLADGYKNDTNYAEFKNSSDGELKKLEQNSSRSSKNSDQEVSMKKQRRSKPFYLTSSPLHSAHVQKAEGSPSQREGFRCCAEPTVFDPLSRYVAAVQPHSHFPCASSQHVDPARSSFATEKTCSLHRALFQMEQQGEQGLRRRQERSGASTRLLPKSISRGHSLPFTAHDSLGSFNVANDGKGVGHVFLTDAQQFPCVYERNSDQWDFLKKEPTPVHSRHPSEDLFSAQPLDLGHRVAERAAADSQTAFDVLKSIWSPKGAHKDPIFPVSRGLGCLCSAHQPPLPKELTSEQGRPREFLQLCSIIPQQYPSTYRQNPEREVYLPSRHPQHRSGLFSVLSKPRVHSCEVLTEQGRTSDNYQFSGLSEAAERTQRTTGQGRSRSENQAYELEKLLQMERTQQLQLFQQLPMSYFPPSEALEKRNSPLCTLQDHLLGQSSPEPWAFPRMKLY